MLAQQGFEIVQQARCDRPQQDQRARLTLNRQMLDQRQAIAALELMRGLLDSYLIAASPPLEV